MVVVGDPLQLELITTLPFRAEQAIQGDHRVDAQWLSSRTSVQRLADRLTHLGTQLPGDDGKIWVGSPLIVHRRCDQPMFGVVDDIAYGGLMINETTPTAAQRFQESYPSLRYPGLVAGTIHTAQGKQAEIVILVLGSDPQRDGARCWAASKPNLLNVTVSRAKRRLYVIGDRQAWGTQRHFDILAYHLPHSPPRQPSGTCDTPTS